VFLQTRFPNAADGDLWKRASWTLKTNLDTATEDRIDAFRAAADLGNLAQLEEYLDVAHAVRVWAVDALLPNADGPWAGGLNFYLYDRPDTGKFMFVPWDLDGAFTDPRPTAVADPFVWHKEERFHGRPWYDVALADDAWFDLYVQSISDVVGQVYNPDTLLPLVDQWTEQIRDAAMADQHKPFDNDNYLSRVERFRTLINERHAFVTMWLACWEAGGIRDELGYCQVP